MIIKLTDKYEHDSLKLPEGTLVELNTNRDGDYFVYQSKSYFIHSNFKTLKCCYLYKYDVFTNKIKVYVTDTIPNGIADEHIILYDSMMYSSNANEESLFITLLKEHYTTMYNTLKEKEMKTKQILTNLKKSTI